MKTKITMILILLLFAINCYAACPGDNPSCRKHFAKRLSYVLSVGYDGWTPIIRTAGKGDTVLFIESPRISYILVAGILDTNNQDIKKNMKICGFKIVYFVHQWYNSQDFRGWTYYVENEALY
jgi:hypothetical protein